MQRALLALGYAVALALGVAGGIASRGRSTPTPLAQLGFVLEREELTASAEAHRRLAEIAHAAKTEWKESAEILDLVLTVRGIGSGGETDFARASSQCQALRWPRCDEPALRELQRRSRP